METAVTPEPRQRRRRRIMRRIGSVLYWTAVVGLGAFGIYFSFANYPWFGVVVVLLALVLIVHSERKRRAAREAAEAARRRNRQETAEQVFTRR